MEFSATVSSAQQNLRRLTRIIGVGIALAGALLIAVIAYTGWTSNTSEVCGEHARVKNALNRIIFRTLDQQKSVAWWDDAIVYVTKTPDLDFMESNLGISSPRVTGTTKSISSMPTTSPSTPSDGAREDPSDFYGMNRSWGP